MDAVEARLKELGLELPECPTPVAAYVPAVKAGEFVYASGQTAIVDGKPVHPGKLGADVSIEQGYEAAKICALRCLAEVKSVIGSLDRVKRIVKVTGYVASAPGFGDQPKVVNGASELFRAVFGPKGEHARAAIGVAELPGGACVEVEIIAQVEGG
ncbi:MAG TPA: RidA family protein [Firmicutes bacterium]|nr:RidA family protein [Bacillota bacterium]